MKRLFDEHLQYTEEGKKIYQELEKQIKQICEDYQDFDLFDLRTTINKLFSYQFVSIILKKRIEQMEKEEQCFEYDENTIINRETLYFTDYGRSLRKELENLLKEFYKFNFEEKNFNFTDLQSLFEIDLSAFLIGQAMKKKHLDNL